MSETDEQFVERMTPFHGIKSTDSVRLPGDDFARLFALALRGSDAADRIEQLEAALRPLACTCKAKHQADCSRSEVDCPFWTARAALEDRT